jgi:hypothetical protein
MSQEWKELEILLSKANIDKKILSNADYYKYFELLCNQAVSASDFIKTIENGKYAPLADQINLSTLSIYDLWGVLSHLADACDQKHKVLARSFAQKYSGYGLLHIKAYYAAKEKSIGAGKWF